MSTEHNCDRCNVRGAELYHFDAAVSGHPWDGAALCDSCTTYAAEQDEVLAGLKPVGWTVITETGLPIWANGVFKTEADARAWVFEHPLTPAGSRQYAVPDHIADAALTEYKRIGAEQERVLAEARRAAVGKLFEQDWSVSQG